VAEGAKGEKVLWPAEEPLGARLRERRTALGLTLKDVADAAGLSVGFISQVERDLTVPSLSSLVSIARVLQEPVARFLAQPQGDRPFTRHDERDVYAVRADGLKYERLSARFPGNVVNSVIVHEPPGYRTESIQHEGEELFFILKGEITVEIEDEATILSAGDSIHFDSTRSHSSWNHTTEPVTMLHVCTMDVFGDKPGDDDHPGNRARHQIVQEPGPEGNKD